MVSPGQKRAAVADVAREGLCSMRAASRALGLSWSSFCYRARKATEPMRRLAAEIVRLSKAYPRYGYRRIRALLVRAGWRVSRRLVQRIRYAQGLGVKPSKRKRRRQGVSTGRFPQRAKHPNHVWSWDFVADRTDQGAPLRVLGLIDEFTRQCLSLTVERQLKAADIVGALKQAIAERGAPLYIRSDNGPEFIAGVTREYLENQKIKTLYIDPGSPWQNGHAESFNSRLRDECLNQEWFLSVAEARVIITHWGRERYNRIHPHSRLGFLAPDTFAKLWHQAHGALPRVLDCVRPTASLRQGLIPQPQPLTP